MKLGLGIDTGGTYTDGALYDFDNKQVLSSAKARTTPEALERGIDALLKQLKPERLKDVRLVSLSTTLATNACVEGRGGRVGLILMGYDEKLVDQLKGEYGLTNAGVTAVIPGGHTQWGDVQRPPEEEALFEAVESMRHTVDAIGVVEYWGIRNPEYEKWAKNLIRAWTGLPVTAAHELTLELNSMRRAATTLLNARLVPLIDELIDAVLKSMDAYGIDAPLMIVRGDGSLMTEAFAREFPVETLLSGPASSATGAKHLSDEDDLIMLDVGGTTTDLALCKSRRVQLTNTGVEVGQWRTGTRAVAIKTIGLGGDSAIALDKQNALTLGPARAIPLCVLASQYPSVVETLSALVEERRSMTYSRGVFFVKQREPGAHIPLTKEERAILTALEGGPLTIEQLSRAINSRPYFLKTHSLETLGLVIRSTLTPTDLMHLRGDFNAYDRNASALGLELLAWQMDVPMDELIDYVYDQAAERIYRLVANYLLERMNRRPIDEPSSLHAGYLGGNDEIDIQFAPKMPIVGIGAPARVMLHKAAQRLRTRLILPEQYAVANAVGAITGGVLVEETVLVQPIYDALGIKAYSAFSSANHYSAEQQAEVVEWAEKEAQAIARQKAEQMGAETYTIHLETEDLNASSTRGSMLLETRVVARIVGEPGA